MQARTLPRCREKSRNIGPLRYGCRAAAALAFSLSLTVSSPARIDAQTADANTAESRTADPREMFETAGQLFVELQSKPPAFRTRADYSRTIEAYRSVYHAAPTSVRAEPSAYAVAELTDEMGHRYQDTAVLQQAVKQYRFLLRAYPASKHRAEALLAIGNIEAENLNDRVAAREAYQDLITHLGDTAPATEARGKLAALDSLPAEKPAAKAVMTEIAAAEPAPSPTNALAKTETPTEPQAQHQAILRSVRHWSTAEYTRIAIDVDQQVLYEVGEVPEPERIFFDLNDTRAGSPVTKTYEINDGLVKRIRVAPYRANVARVVVELSAPADYTPFVLPNPWRIMVEVRPKYPGGTAQQKAAASGIVAQPFTLPGGQPATPPARVKPASTEERTSTPVKVASGGKRTAEPPAGPSNVASISNATTSEHSVARVKTEVAREVARSGATISDLPDAPMTKRTATAKKAAEDPERPREAQPTSSGERSLTRALGLKIGRIVIDAGHGGHDTGAVGPTGYREKDLVLDVALRLGKLLEQKMGAEVVYTRDDDTFIPLEERTNIANHAGADLFVSVHANFSSDTTARGVETYYLNFSASDESLEVAARENATSQKTVHELQDLVQNIALKEKIDESREFAADVQKALWAGEVTKSPGLRNRGVKKAPFIVLIGAHMPSILAEISFVSNPTDERRLRTADYRQRIAESLYRGINRYASGLSGVKFAANNSAKPSGTAVAGTPSSAVH